MPQIFHEQSITGLNRFLTVLIDTTYLLGTHCRVVRDKGGSMVRDLNSDSQRWTRDYVFDILRDLGIHYIPGTAP